MQAHRMNVVIPADHQLLVQVPEEVRSGPVELIFLAPSEGDSADPTDPSPDPKALARLKRIDAELAADPRPFEDLSPAQREERLRRLRGIGRGLLSSSEEFARRKQEEIEIEERKFGR